MNRKLFPAAIALAWITLPLTAFHYWQNWDRLPLRIAVHFDANWQPNGWSSREGARMLALGTTAFLLATFTIAASAARIAKASRLSLWSMVVVFYVALGLVYYVNAWIVERSLPPVSKPLAELVLLRDVSQGLKPADLSKAGNRTLSKRILQRRTRQNDFPQERNYKTSMELSW